MRKKNSAEGYVVNEKSENKGKIIFYITIGVLLLSLCISVVLNMGVSSDADAEETGNIETDNIETGNIEISNIETANKENIDEATSNREISNKETSNRETDNKKTDNKETNDKETDNKESTYTGSSDETETQTYDELSSGVHGGISKREYMINVSYISQKNDYPTGCESVSAVMALQHWGVKISVDEFIDEYLVKSDFYWDSDGIMHAEHPAEKFVGNPRESMAFGCYAPVIEKALRKIFIEKDTPLEVVNEQGMNLNDLCGTYIDNNIPVIIWASMDMKPTRNGRTWVLENGEKFTWIAGEHCLLLTGYDEKYYYFNDPLVGKDVAYKKEIVELRYKELGYQALVIK